MGETAVKATSLGGEHRPSREFGRGRVCGRPGCDTRLSIYNSGSYCYLHEPLVVPRMRGKKLVS